LHQPIGRLDDQRPLTRSKSDHKKVLENEVPKLIGWRRKVRFKISEPPYELELEANTTKHPKSVKDVMEHVYRVSQIQRRARMRNQKRKRRADDVLKRAYEVFLVRKIGRIDMPEDDFLKEYEGHLEEIERTKVFARVRKGNLPTIVRVKKEKDGKNEYPINKRKKLNHRVKTETSGRLEGVKRKRSHHCGMPPTTKRRTYQRSSNVPATPVLQATPISKRSSRPSPSLSPVVTFGVAFQEDVLEEVLRLTHKRAAELLQDEEMVDWVASYPYNIHKEHQPDHMREILNDALLLISRNQRAPKFVLTVYRDAASNIITNSQYPPEKYIPFLPSCIQIEFDGGPDSEHTEDSNSPPNTPPHTSLALPRSILPQIKKEIRRPKPHPVDKKSDGFCPSFSFLDSVVEPIQSPDTIPLQTRTVSISSDSPYFW